MIVSDKVKEFFYGGSAIRSMFEEGLRLKQIHGAEAVADLSIGNPEFPPPDAFIKAFREVARRPLPHAYMPNAGYPDVRKRVADYLVRSGFFPEIEGQHIVMTTGAAGALNVVLKTILDPGEEVIVPRPYFIEYRFYIDHHGGKMVLVETNEDAGLDVDAIANAINKRTRAVILNSPNNPTGRIYDRATLEALAAVLRGASSARDRPIFLLSDEPYRDVRFDGVPFTSPASLYENSFMCYSWSKSFSISGERIGYIAVNPRMTADDWPRVMGSLSMCNRFLGFVNAPAFMQHVIAEAIDAEPDIAHYARKRQKLCAALDEGGYDYALPEGTFYVFPRTLGPERAFVERARELLLLVVPGSAFGREGFFRISFAAPEPTVDLACEKLKELARVPSPF